MFDAGFTELILIMVIALLVVGPERLPGLARKVGLWIGKARTYFNSVRSDIERELRADELKQMLNQQQEEIHRLRTMVEDTGHELEEDLKETERSMAAEQEPPTAARAEETPSPEAEPLPQAKPEPAPSSPEDAPPSATSEEATSEPPDEQRR